LEYEFRKEAWNEPLHNTTLWPSQSQARSRARGDFFSARCSDANFYCARCFTVWLAVAGSGFVFGADPSFEKETLFSPSELVTAALQAELRFDSATRTATLARAVAETPQNGPARWHSGYVRVDNQWLALDEAEKKTAADPRLIEYRQLRQLSGSGLEDQIALAKWCRKQNLDEYERFHWSAVMQLQPQNKEAQVRLGLQEFRGFYLTRDEIDDFKKQIERYDEAQKKWKPQVEKWRTALGSRDEHVRNAALAELNLVKDVQAVPVLEQLLVPVSTEAELAVIHVLQQMDDRLATNLLMRHAVLSESEDARLAAALALKPRSLFAYVPTLLGSLKTPIEYSYYTDTFRTEGPAHVFEILPTTDINVTFVNELSNRGGRRVMTNISRRSTSPSVKARQAEYVKHLNLASETINQRVCQALRISTGQQLPTEPQAWWGWWQAFNELQSSQELSQKSLITMQRRPKIKFQTISRYRMSSCFLAGTMVWLDTGPQPIEKVRAGDRVLSQDENTGELSYRFVVGTTIRPPSKTLRFGLPNEEIVATLGHPIWVVGKGWRMAKEIVAGDQLHGINGSVPVEFIEKGPEAEAYNLVVAEFNTYFVGEHRVLVHDNAARSPTKSVLPGLVEASVVGLE
jgi:hypothetical protein